MLGPFLYERQRNIKIKILDFRRIWLWKHKSSLVQRSKIISFFSFKPFLVFEEVFSDILWQTDHVIFTVDHKEGNRNLADPAHGVVLLEVLLRRTATSERMVVPGKIPVSNALECYSPYLNAAPK